MPNTIEAIIDHTPQFFVNDKIAACVKNIVILHFPIKERIPLPGHNLLLIRTNDIIQTRTYMVLLNQIQYFHTPYSPYSTDIYIWNNMLR